MMKISIVLLLALLLASCGAGGGAVSAGGVRVQAQWPELGWDRYEPVVFPAAAAVEP